MTKNQCATVAALIEQARAVTDDAAMCAWIDSITLEQAVAIEKYMLANDLVETDLFPYLYK